MIPEQLTLVQIKVHCRPDTVREKIKELCVIEELTEEAVALKRYDFDM